MSIAYVDEAVVLLLIPAVAELRNPGKRLSTAHLDKNGLKHLIKQLRKKTFQHFKREKNVYMLPAQLINQLLLVNLKPIKIMTECQTPLNDLKQGNRASFSRNDHYLRSAVNMTQPSER